MKSINTSSRRGVDSVIHDPRRRDFSRKIEKLQVTASSRINSHREFDGIVETRDSLTVEGSDFMVNERDFDRQAHTHHTSKRLASQ